MYLCIMYYVYIIHKFDGIAWPFFTTTRPLLQLRDSQPMCWVTTDALAIGWWTHDSSQVFFIKPRIFFYLFKT